MDNGVEELRSQLGAAGQAHLLDTWAQLDARQQQLLKAELQVHARPACAPRRSKPVSLLNVGESAGSGLAVCGPQF